MSLITRSGHADPDTQKVRAECNTYATRETRGTMTALAVDFKTHKELLRERDMLVRKSGLPLEELIARAEDYTLTVSQYAMFEAIADINYLLSE